MATGKGGLKRGLKGRSRTLLLLTDETFITETPPLSAKWSLKGKQSLIAISGNRAKRVLYGTMSLTGGLILSVSTEWNQLEFQGHLEMIRQSWRGWNLVLFLDKGSPHTAEETRWYAEELEIELRFLPTACPKLNPMDHLWRHIKRDVLANFVSGSLEEDIEEVYQYLQEIGPMGWSQKAGLLSEDFWLKEYCPLREF